MSDQAVTIGALPPELLRQVFDALDHIPPSDHRLNEQPDSDMLRDSDCQLKNISLVSKQWREIVLPMLFRHVIWRLPSCDHLLAYPNEDSHSQSDLFGNIPFLVFLRSNDLARHVRSLTIIVCRKVASSCDATSEEDALDTSGNAQRKRERWNTTSDTQAQYLAQTSSATIYRGNNNWLWQMLFDMMDPLRLTLIASPQTLARLLSCMVFVGDADFFSNEERLHILSLSRDSCSKGPSAPFLQPRETPQAVPQTSHKCATEREYTRTELFTIRPWTHLLLNENSSIRVYRTYHFFDRRPPSILTSLLGWEEAPLNVMMVPPSITSLSYIAIFPIASHFSMLVYRLPRIKNLYLQLVPRNDILLDKKEMDHVNASDLWLERNSCYQLAMQYMLVPMTAGPLSHTSSNNNNNNNNNIINTINDNGDSDDDGEDGDLNAGPGEHAVVGNPDPGGIYNWEHLRRLETGDLSDREAWLDAVDWVEESQTGWRVERYGVFVKEPRPPKV
ncbi:hypothetical protein P885DRAFT_46011 [Corynascus similis CBS 632.67]